MPALAGKVAIVTGSSQGMGAVTAELFAREGAVVIGADIAPPARAQPGVEYLRLDITSETEWRGLVETVLARHGRLDVLVNNAAINHAASVAATPIADFRRVLDINVAGGFLGVQACAPAMERSGGGSIVNISSVDGLYGKAGRTAYVTSKWAVRGMTKAMAMEFAPLGIRVNSVHPGAIETPMLMARGGTAERIAEDLAIPFGRVGKPEEVARASLYLASDAASYVSGTELVVDGAWSVGPNRRPVSPPAEG